MNNAQLRAQYRELRLQFSAEQLTTHANLVKQHLLHSGLLVGMQRIAGYHAFAGELDPQPIAETVWQQHKEYYLPVLHPAGYQRLLFGKFNPNDNLVKNRLNILEPTYQSEQLLYPWGLDIVLTPLVAFTTQGHRLGMGGGFYDQTFAFRQQLFRQKPILVGLAHQAQLAKTIDVQPWDIQLDYVITEERCYHCKTSTN